MNGSGISVIICCYNSATRLPTTLKYLAVQNAGHEIPWEIIIVNNCSTDNTVDVAKEEWQKHRSNISLHIVEEQQPGLSFARQAGIAAAKYEYIIFCDDDNWLDENYLSTAYQTMQLNKNIGALGGWGTAVSDAVFPDWFPQYEGGYAVGKPLFGSGEVPQGQYLVGAGLVFKKSVFQQAYDQFPTLLTDRMGNQLTAGGDTEFIMRLLLMGYKIYFEASLHFKHFIPAERLTLAYRDKLFSGFKSSSGVLDIYSLYIHKKSQTFLNKIGIVLKCLIRLITCAIQPIRGWQLSKEISLLYHYTGIRLGRIHKSETQIRQFLKKFSA